MKILTKDWTNFEKVWLLLFLGLSLASTIYFSVGGTDYSKWNSILLNWVIAPVSAISGIVCVVLVAKGKISNYIWGTINCITYGYIAYLSGYYGDAIINIFYFLPFQLIGWLWWRKHLRPKSDEDVIMRKMTWKQIIVLSISCVIATFIVGIGLFKVDAWFVNVMKRNVSIYQYIENVFHIPLLGPVFDASTEIFQFVAQILMTIAFAEQWILWILTNIFSIIMWASVIIAEPTSLPWAMPTLVMWVAYLVNSFYGYIVWLRGAKQSV